MWGMESKKKKKKGKKEKKKGGANWFTKRPDKRDWKHPFNFFDSKSSIPSQNWKSTPSDRAAFS